MVCEPERVRPLYNILGVALHREAGISLHTGKTRVWAELSQPVWKRWDLACGIAMASRCREPLGTTHFVASYALHMIHQRTPAVVESVVTALGQEEQLGSCAVELQAERLDHEGFWWRPSWEALRRGERPPLMNVGEPGKDTRLAVLGIIHFRHLLSESPAVKTVLLFVRRT